MFRFVVLFLLLSQAYSYLLPQQAAMGALSRPSLARRQGVVALRAKGFADKPKPREKSEGQIKRESESAKFDDISSAGGQSYQIFVRLFGQDGKSWLPSGQIAVPRGEQVANAIYANEAGVKAAAARSWPNFKGKEEEMEFGFNLVIYPDEEIQVATKPSGASGGGLGKWFSELLSPVDTSEVKK
mmetsp:Transcript_30059/g.59694  ORF Transcript_30059/g.59694 Transcript_30059/m.59694 type:complete len:185 (+) Transcript_30059:54-608(+)